VDPETAEIHLWSPGGRPQRVAIPPLLLLLLPPTPPVLLRLLLALLYSQFGD